MPTRRNKMEPRTEHLPKIRVGLVFLDPLASRCFPGIGEKVSGGKLVRVLLDLGLPRRSPRRGQPCAV